MTWARRAAVPALLVIAPLVAVAVLAWTSDPQVLVPAVAGEQWEPARWGLPVARAVRDLGSALTIGILVLVACAMPAESKAATARIGPAQLWLLKVAAVCGGVWVLSGFAAMLFTYADLAGAAVPVASWGAALGSFVMDFDLGRSLLANLLLGAIVSAGAMVARRLTTVGLVAVVSVMSPWPLALTGHAAGAVNHDMAVNAQAVHLIGISVWIGGLAGLFLVRHRLGGSAAAVVARFSALATVGFVLVALSGILAAMLRLGTPSALLSTYGMLVVIKVAALSLLGFAGWYQRRRIRRVRSAVVDRAREIRWLLLCELVVMAAAIGIGVALGRTPPPGEERPLTTAESLLGYAMPPELGGAEWFTQWRVDTLWTPLALVGAACYLWGIVRLRRRGDRWPAGPSIAWLAGTVLLIWATSGAPGVYGDVLFSMHMVQHMTIATAVPTLLVLGAPVTLALRTARPRRDGSRGWREWLLVTVKSRPLAVLGHPLVAAGLFVVGLVAFYYTPLFEFSLRTHTGHQLMLLHFLLSGYLFASVICGTDPGAARPAYPLRVLLLMVTFGFHAFFSISLMSSGVVLAGDWYGALGRPWGESLERDQYVGASLGWALGDYPLALMAIGMVVGWVKSDLREAQRFDRRADRDGDKSLSDYNEYLGRLGRHESADAETREKLS